MLPAPGFHHPHLNSIDPDAAVEFLHQTVPARVAKLRGEGVRFLEGALHARLHARGDDRGPEPRSAGAGRGHVRRHGHRSP